MHRRSPLIWAAGNAVLLVATLAACGSAVEVTVADRASDPLCTKAAQRWPATVGGQSPHAVSVESAAVRAWGDPTIIARCGLTSPAPTTDQCIDANGVDWVARRLDDGVVFTTYGRDPAIEVLVPQHYRPEPLVLAAFAAAAQQIPQGTHQCSSGAASS